MLKIEDVYFGYYAGTTTLNGVGFEVSAGEIVGLIGANGSGKSTLLNCVFDLLRLRGGSVTVNGFDHQSIDAKLSAVMLPSEDLLPEFLTGREYLDLLFRLYGQAVSEADVEALLDRLSMSGRSRDLIEDYSHGMRKKLQLASAILLERPLTVIDETMNGIDFEAIHICEREYRRMRDNGGAIVLCTHDFRFLERVADRVVLLSHGDVIHDDRLPAVRERYGSIEGLVEDLILGVTE